MWWQGSKATGDAGERIAAGLIRREWRDVSNVTRIASTLDAQRRGDLLVRHKCGREWTVEIKSDDWACQSGLLAIEIARRVGVADAATGLSTASATAGGFLIADRLILCLPDRLRELLAHKRAGGTLQEKRVGDGGRTLVALMPIDEVALLAGSYVIARGGAA